MEIATATLDYLSAVKHLAPTTRVGYQQRLNTFAEWCAAQQITLEALDNRHMQAFFSWLSSTHRPNKSDQAKLSAETLRGYMRVLKALMSWCLDDPEYRQYVSVDQMKRLKMPHEEKFVKQAFSHEEAEALFAAATHPSRRPMYRVRDTSILSLLLDCGLRANELVTLTIGHVTLAKISGDDSYVTVWGKNSKQREVSLGDRSRRALSRYLREYRSGAQKSEPVFLSRYNKPFSTHALEDTLRRLGEASTMPDMQVNPHKCRHTFATMYIAQGGDVYSLSKMLGHSRVTTTEKYLESLSARALRTREKRPSVLDNL